MPSAACSASIRAPSCSSDVPFPPSFSAVSGGARPARTRRVRSGASRSDAQHNTVATWRSVAKSTLWTSVEPSGTTSTSQASNSDSGQVRSSMSPWRVFTDRCAPECCDGPRATAVTAISREVAVATIEEPNGLSAARTVILVMTVAHEHGTDPTGSPSELLHTERAPRSWTVRPYSLNSTMRERTLSEPNPHGPQ